MPEALNVNCFSCLLLAGGRSTRMGVDKARLVWRGHELWRLQLAKLNYIGARRVLIAAREEQCLHKEDLSSGLNAEWLLDPPDEDMGPMGPIHRALALVQMPLLVLAVDMPLLPAEYLRDHLLKQLGNRKGFVHSTSQGLEPLAAVYVTGMLPLIANCISERRTGLQAMFCRAIDLGLAESQKITSTEECYFENFNAPDAWEKMKAG